MNIQNIEKQLITHLNSFINLMINIIVFDNINNLDSIFIKKSDNNIIIYIINALILNDWNF